MENLTRQRESFNWNIMPIANAFCFLMYSLFFTFDATMRLAFSQSQFLTFEGILEGINRRNS